MDRSIAARSLVVAIVYGAVAQALLVRHAAGVNVTILAVALLAAGFVLARRADPVPPFDRFDAWLPPTTIALAAAVAVRADPFLVLLDVVTTVLLLGASMAAIGGVAVTRRSATAVVALGTHVFAWCGIGILRLLAPLAAHARAEGRLVRLPGWLVPVVRGLLLAVPVLLVFVALFSAADAAFARLADDVASWSIDLGELPVRAATAVLVAWLAAGLLAVAIGGLVAPGAGPDAGGTMPDGAAGPAPRWQSLGAAAAEPAPPLRLGAVEAATILVVVDLLFAAFVGIQVAYLFGGLDTLAATGFTYAEYARRGFFELVAVTALAGALVTAIHAVAARRTPAIVGAGLVLAGLSAVVLLSAFLRLRLYQEAYGWTELRFYVLATIAWLGLGIVVATVLLARGRMGWLVHGLVFAALAVLIAANLVGPVRFVADQNVARLLVPSLVPPDGRHGLDVSYAWSLGPDAAPALVGALPALDEPDRRYLLETLLAQRRELADPAYAGWPAWNLAREEARRALAPLAPDPTTLGR